LWQVRGALEEQSGVAASVEDVMRRAERLVAAGVIDKMSLGRSDSFRSVAYTYLSEEDAGGDDDDDAADVTGRVAADGAPAAADALALDGAGADGSGGRALGEDLYHHLRAVLGVRRLPDGAPGVSKQVRPI